MGNVLESKIFSEKPVAVVPPIPAKESQAKLNAEAAEEGVSPKTNVSFHLFHYRQQMALKENHVVKWATSKLLLTEELLKQQQQTQSNQLDLSAPLHNFDNDDDASWASKQLAYLTDDEDDENIENLNQTWGKELHDLVKYRSKLCETIIQESQEKLHKREKVKLKRLKRRTLISSKKPSKKDKRRPPY